jgi:MscS family membrane protein
LTVALAAQDTLKNLFGSLMILLDRPFQVGDVIRIKGHEGKVESVGLRSTRIRDVSGHVVSISNDEMARLDSKNLSSRKHLRRQEVLRVRPDTPPEKLQGFVGFVRDILRGHECMDPQSPPSVQIGFGDAAVTVTITYHYASQNSAAFAEFNERTTLRILERMQQDGIRLAPAGHAAHGETVAHEHLAPHAVHAPHEALPGGHEHAGESAGSEGNSEHHA